MPLHSHAAKHLNIISTLRNAKELILCDMKNVVHTTLQIGRYNRLRIARRVDFGVYLDGGAEGDILMPARYVPQGVDIGDAVDCLVYHDSEDRLVATTEQPIAFEGDFACLECKAVNRFGAFLDWGVAKDLLVPYKEQRTRMEPGRRYVVRIYADPASGRLAATEKIARYLDNLAPRYTPGQQVDILVCERTQLGYKAIVNSAHTGLLYHSDIKKPLDIGYAGTAYIQRLRDDDRIDLSLLPTGYHKVDDLRHIVLRRLRENGGRMLLGDKSDPGDIRLAFGCSKKAFKMTIGTLYREGLIDIGDNTLKLL